MGAVEPSYKSGGPGPRVDTLDATLHRLERSYRETLEDLATTQLARNLALEMLAQSEERLARVRALVDLAEWAQRDDDFASCTTSASVRTSDLRRALE